MATRDVESLRTVVEPGFMVVEAAHPDVHMLNTSDLEKLRLTQREADWENAKVSDVKSETSSTHPSIASASFMLTVPLADAQVSQMQRMLRDSEMPLDKYQRHAIKEAITAKQITASMFAMLGKRNGKWKIMCITSHLPRFQPEVR